jgi:hypothetical protein
LLRCTMPAVLLTEGFRKIKRGVVQAEGQSVRAR